MEITKHLRVLFFLTLLSVNTLLAQHVIFPFKIGNGLTFVSSDTLIVSRPINRIDEHGKAIYQIFMHILQNEKWSEAIALPFSNGVYTDYHPELMGDSLLFFISRRPEPGTIKPVPYGNLWYVQRTKGNWGEPEFLYEINHPGQDTYPTFTNTGTLYFNSDRTGGKGAMDIYRSEYVNGSFQKPEAQDKLNTLDSENDLVIDPDESFIIFNRYSLESKELDLYIAFRHNNTWGNPVPIESLNKKGQFELTPTINKYDGMFYYEVNGDIYSESLTTLLDTVNR